MATSLAEASTGKTPGGGFNASLEGWADMNWKARLVASTVAAFAVLVLTSLQGCLSAVSKAPASSIVEESRPDRENSEKEVRHQPTILRAEAAAPPASDRPADVPVGSSVPDAPFNEFASTAAASHSAHPQIADLLPISSQDAPPPNQR